MATMTMEPTIIHSSTHLRSPYNTSAAPSLASTLPPLHFGFDDLRARMTSFTQRFDEFISQGRKRVLAERNQFRMDVAAIQEDQTQTHRALSLLTQKSTHHTALLASQAAETHEMHSSISALVSTREQHLSNVTALRARIAHVKTVVDVKKHAHREQSQYLAQQAVCNGPELEFWEECLGLRIEGTGREERVRFVFRGCDERKGERECWFEVNMGGGEGRRGYEVVGMRPRVETGRVERCVERMCAGEDLGGFLKGMRALFVEELR